MAEPDIATGQGLERTLSREHYLSPEIFAREKEHIFLREWFYAGREEDVATPGSYLVVDVAGESVLVVRTREGQLRAYYNVCRHRGCQLVLTGSDSTGSAPELAGSFGSGIKCPYHAWTYTLDGALRTAPYLDEGAGIRKEELSLHPVGIERWGGFFFLNLTPLEAAASGHTLARQLGDAALRLANYPLADLRRVKRITYEVDANWKVMLENYNECYHCAGVHPELCKVVPSFKVRGGSNLDWERGIEHAEGAWTFTHSGTSTREPFPGLSDDERVRHKGELILSELHDQSLRGSRRGIHGLAEERRAHHDRLRLSLSSERDRKAGLRSLGRNRFLGSREPAGLGDLRRRAARDAEPRVRLRLLRTDGELQSRHSGATWASDSGSSRRDTPVKRDYEYIVLGLGGLGSGAAYWLSRKAGAEVLGIEQFELGHVRGESQDHSRIIRLSYHTPEYVELAKLAYDAWSTLRARER